MGGYGANLKRRTVGYSIKGSDGLSRALELRQMNVPLIDTPEALKEFIQNTPMMKRAVAIIKHKTVMDYDSEPDCMNENLFYAIVYEKRAYSDSLFIYSSNNVALDSEYISTYFRPKFFLFTPHEIRETIPISALYAIQDAKTLCSYMNEDCNDMMCQRGMEHLFYLDKVFNYNEKALIYDHITTMVTAIEHQLSDEQKHIPSI